MASEVVVAGNDEERKSFYECYRHYIMSQQDLRKRMVDFDKRDVLFRSYIVKNSWPYRAQVFDPRVFTAIFEKTSRILANKPRGRMLPRESGDALGAKINNELLNFQWDDNERADSTPMLAKWAMMDMNARKYGASFGLCKWHYQRVYQKYDIEPTGEKKSGKSVIYFDGPNFKPWPNRDVLHNPSYPTVKNWIILRDYVTWQELTETNDAARGKPIYKNLDILRTSLMQAGRKGGDTRAANYSVRDKTIKGLVDYLGQDEVYKTLEVCTEYRPERWITFVPKHGIVIRDIPNPYNHGQIPVVQLKYYPIDDDIYGLSEIEPIEKLQNAVNAALCQYLDAINISLYTPLKIRNTNGAVQMHTLEFGPGKKWLMNNPAEDVLPHQPAISGIGEFATTYRLLISSMQEALGETSADVSQLSPGNGDKTATEVKDLAQSRNARDNFNQIFLSEAIQKQMMFWYKMNQQFMLSTEQDKQKVITIVGKDALSYFQGQGLDAQGLDDDAIKTLSDPAMAGIVGPEDLQKPLFPVKTKEGTQTKLRMEPGSGYGQLTIEKGDLEGDYKYIPDVGSMSNDANDMLQIAKSRFIDLVTGMDPKTGQPTGINMMIQQEGKKVKAAELMIDYAEDLGFKNADQYIEGILGQQPGEPQMPGMQPQMPMNGQQPMNGQPQQPNGQMPQGGVQ
ncbi:MAG TPA: hypothetical protein VF974_07470 [Patescibacteria group bacterium]